MTRYTIRRGIDARRWLRREEPVTSAELAVDIASDAEGQLWGYSPDVWVDDGVQDFTAVEITEILDADGDVLMRYENGQFANAYGDPIEAEAAVAYLESACEPLQVSPEWKRLQAVEQAARALLADHDGGARAFEPIWYKERIEALRRELGDA